MTYETIDVQEMSPACGAIVEGLDLSGELTNRQFDEIHQAVSASANDSDRHGAGHPSGHGR